MKRKTPQEKKFLSYAKDRRNAYGESRANSRFSIRRNKTLPKRAYRHLISQILNGEAKESNEENLEVIESKVRGVKRRNWKKFPDVPLSEWVKNRFEYRKIMFRAKINRKSKSEE